MDGNEAAFRGVFDAFRRGDAEAAGEFYADDAVVVDEAGPTEYQGREAITGLIREFAALLPDLEMEIVDLVAHGDRVAGELHGRGTPVGQAEPVELRYCLFNVFRDGKIVSEHLYADSAQLSTGA